MTIESWLPAYDSESLVGLIEEIRDNLHSRSFFSHQTAVAKFCQGDVIQIPADLPLLDSNAVPAVEERVGDLWLVAGNTCDFDRDLTKVPWTQLLPLEKVGTADDVAEPELNELKAYRASRYFYVPDWSAGKSKSHYLAQLSKPVTTHKSAVLSSKLVARLSESAWVLLSACLVRFLARDDRRFVA